MPRVNVPGVGSVNFPDTMSPEEIKGAIERDILPKRQAEKPIDPTEGMSGTQKFLAGAGKAFVDIGRGAAQLFGADNQQEIDDAKARDASLMNTGTGVVGNVVGNVAASALPAAAAAFAAPVAAAVPALSGAATAVRGAAAAHPLIAAMAPGAASGALMGALEPVATGESRGKNVALNAGIGAAGAAIPRAFARVAKPNVSDDVAKLISEGVEVTPGQAMGGAFKTAEEKLSSVPLLGSMIRRAQERGIESFDRAAYNRALAPIGESVGKNFKVGREGVAEVEKRIGTAYDRVLDKIGRVDLDEAFRNEVGKVTSMADELGESAAKQFQAIVQNRVVGRMTPAGTMSADTMKIVESDLGMAARRYSSSADANQRGLGAALREVQASLRRAVERSAGPEAATELQGANKAWAEFVRVQDAAGRIGAKEGVFTPSQYTSAVRSQDKSVRKGAFARGGAMGQDLAEAGKSSLAAEIPNSGTADRIMAAGAMPALLALPPELLALGAAGMLPYTKLGGKVTLAALTKRPEQAKALAELLRLGAPAGGVAAAGMGLPRFGE